MSSTDKFVHSAVKSSCAALCQAIGWNAAQPAALDVLSDVFQRYFMDVAKRTHRYAEICGRSEPNLEDAAVVFEEMHISIPELEEYVAHFDPVPFPGPNPPAFPIPRESHLNHLRPGSEEVLTRPVHVHEYMPPMIIEEERKKLEQAEWPTAAGTTTPPGETVAERIEKELEEPEKKPVPVLNGKVNGIDGIVRDGLGSDSDSDDSISRAAGVSPNSPKTIKSKRLESPGENPALKRVRMMLEEEGHPLREITSVMMTTSGFLTSSREGRLPDAKPPPNKDFFEPLTPPVVEKKKKIPTMKKIIEGVKKIDKEKENHSSKDSGDSGLNLFDNPDKIFTTPNAVAANIAAEKAMEKDGTPEKVKEPKEKKEKKDKSEKKSEKKSGSKEEKSDKQKLKIFKKKSMKEVAKEHVAKVKPKTEPESGIEAIESDEDFGATPQNREESPAKKQKKDKEKLVVPTKPSKEKKLKTKPLTGSPLTVTKIPKVPKPPPEPVRIFENPDKIVPVLIGAQKKKRGRPKKAVPPFNLMGGLHGMEAAPTTLKPMKFNRKMLAAQDDVDFKSFVPEISINVKPPPPPDFSLMQRLPLQPGLIPAFVPPTNLKMPSHSLPPSISITPATPTITPSSPAASRNSQFGGLHSNVCSSVTITPIDMSNSQKLPTPFDSQPTPGIGSPNLTSKSATASTTIVPLDSDSGITITPIVMDKQSGGVQVEKSVSGLAKLEQNLKTKEQRKKDKEKRKELKKEKKKEKKEKLKEKIRKDELREKDRDKSVKKEKKDKSEKKKKKDREGSTPSEGTVPKLTLKLQHSATTTPVDSPNPPPSYHGEPDHPPLKKITIKPIEEVRQRSPSPELARFSPLVTRPSKKVPLPKKSPPAVIAKTPKQEVVSFPAVSGGSSSSNSKRGRGRPPKSTKSSHKSSTQAGLITETVGSYIDEQGNKIWICPACGRQDDGSPMIGCESCDDWYHFTCVGITEAPDESDPWFCRKCLQKNPPSFDHRKKVSRL